MPKLLHFKPGGVGIYSDPLLGETEVHTSTCSHCQSVTQFPSRKRMMEHVEICRGCMRLICLGCYGKPCRPFEKEAERQEEAARIQQKIQTDAWRCY